MAPVSYAASGPGPVPTHYGAAPQGYDNYAASNGGGYAAPYANNYANAPTAYPAQADYGYSSQPYANQPAMATAAAGSIVQAYPAQTAEPTPQVQGAKSSTTRQAMERARRSRQMLGGAVIGVLLLALITLGMVFALGGFDSKPNNDNVAQGNRPAAPVEPTPVQRPPATRPPVVRPTQPSESPFSTPTSNPSPTTDPRPTPMPVTPMPSNPAPDPVTPTPTTPTTPTPPTPAPTTPTTPPPSEPPLFIPDPSFLPDPEPKPTTLTNPPPTDPPAPTDPKPMPDPAPMTQLPVTPPTAQELADLGAAMTSARAALSELRIDDARVALEKAEPLARLPEHQAKFERLTRVTDYVGRFREALAKSVSELEPASSITVGTSTQVGIVQTFPDKIIVRVAGTNQTYPFSEMPVGLAAAIFDLVVPDSPDAKMMKGAYVLVSKTANDVNREKARDWWSGAGEELGDLMSFTTDTYKFTPDNGK